MGAPYVFKKGAFRPFCTQNLAIRPPRIQTIAYLPNPIFIRQPSLYSTSIVMFMLYVSIYTHPWVEHCDYYSHLIHSHSNRTYNQIVALEPMSLYR